MNACPSSGFFYVLPFKVSIYLLVSRKATIPKDRSSFSRRLKESQERLSGGRGEASPIFVRETKNGRFILSLLLVLSKRIMSAPFVQRVLWFRFTIFRSGQYQKEQ